MGHDLTPPSFAIFPVFFANQNPLGGVAQCFEFARGRDQNHFFQGGRAPIFPFGQLPIWS